MGHTYTSCFYHVVFSTKERRPTITDDIRPRLWQYLAGIAKSNGFQAIEIGGVQDHVHLLLAVPPAICLSKAVQLLKGGSSKWAHETFPAERWFAWQDGYGGFTVSVSGIERTRRYIRAQAEHHRRSTFQQEFRAFLAKHGIKWDEKYV